MQHVTNRTGTEKKNKLQNEVHNYYKSAQQTEKNTNACNISNIFFLTGGFLGSGFGVSIDLLGMNFVGKLPDNNIWRPLGSST